MTNPGLNDLYQAVGALQASVTALQDRIAAGDARSNEHRDRMYRRLDDLAKGVATLDVDVKAVTGSVAEIEPTVEEWKRLKQRGIGALFVIGLGASALTLVVERLIDWLRPG